MKMHPRSIGIAVEMLKAISLSLVRVSLGQLQRSSDKQIGNLQSPDYMTVKTLYPHLLFFAAIFVANI